MWSLMRIIYRSMGIQSPVDHQLADIADNRNWYRIPLYLGLSGDTSDKHALVFTSYFVNLNYKFSENEMIAQLLRIKSASLQLYSNEADFILFDFFVLFVFLFEFS